jgi:sulfate-transporting ATPase
VLHPAAFTITTFVVFTLCALAVANLRRGRSGRRLLAVRSNERAAASLGISVAGVKLYAFWLAAMIAGVAGSLVQARFSTGDFTTFSLTENVNLVLVAVIGGVGWIAGALLGAQGVPGGVTARTLEVFISDPGKWLLLLGGVGAILAVMYAPNGLAEFEHRQWRWRRRIGTKLIGPLRRRIAARRGRRRRHPEGEPVAAPLAERVAVGRAPAATLEVCDVSVRFGVQDALCHAGLTVSTGEIVGLIGPNGAGKSTMIDVIAGFHRPTAGTVLLNGRAVDGLGPARRVRAGIGRSFQNLELFDDMTVLENLRVAADATSARHYLTDLVWPRAGRLTDAAVAAIDELELQPCLNRLPPELDYAKRRLVAIARTLSLAPSIVMLDEPAAGLDERERQEFARLLRRIAKDWGIGVLLIEHDVQMVFEVCERVIVLDRGTVIADGPAGEVRRSEAVIAAYIGQTDDEDPAPSEARAADGAVVA